MDLQCDMHFQFVCFLFFHCLDSLYLLKEAIKFVQPSLRREGFTSIPDVTWDDVGGLDSLRKEFERYIVRCIKRPEDCDVSKLHLNTVGLCFTLLHDLLCCSL